LIKYLLLFQVPEAEIELSNSISQIWEDLYLQSKWVDASLVSVKMKFTEVSVVHWSCFEYSHFLL
jgi:hypothetical protein